jgi:hypothetical protein
MKRDMDLIRLLLIDAEGEEDIDLSEYSDEQILYHKSLLVDSELCRGAVARGGQGQVVGVHITQLNWQGHDFLDAARNETVWRKVKEKIVSAGGGMTIAIMTQMLKKELAERLGL